MSRLFAIAIGLAFASLASAQCTPWYPHYRAAPSYPWTPAIWGAPAPQPLPPAPPPFVPKAVPSIREEDEPAPAKPPAKSKNGTKGTSDEKDKDTPRIPLRVGRASARGVPGQGRIPGQVGRHPRLACE